MGTLEVSKWLKIPLLLDLDELEALFTAIAPFRLYPIGRVVSLEEQETSLERYLSAYSSYIEQIKKEETVEPEPFLSSALSRDSAALIPMPVKEGFCLNQARRPFVHLQPHRCSFSADKKEFLSMINSKDAISLGLQISYPQIYRDIETLEIIDGYKRSELPNTLVFKAIQQWVRNHTSPTPFLLEEKRKVTIFRLGKKAFSWVNRHQGLVQLGVKVDDRSSHDRQ